MSLGLAELNSYYLLERYPKSTGRIRKAYAARHRIWSSEKSTAHLKSVVMGLDRLFKASTKIEEVVIADREFHHVPPEEDRTSQSWRVQQTLAWLL